MDRGIYRSFVFSPLCMVVLRLKGSRRAVGWKIFLWVPKHTLHLPSSASKPASTLFKNGKYLLLYTRTCLIT